MKRLVSVLSIVSLLMCSVLFSGAIALNVDNSKLCLLLSDMIGNTRENEPIDICILLNDDTQKTDTLEEIKKYSDVVYVSEYSPVIIARATVSGIESISKIPRVKELDYYPQTVSTLNDNSYEYFYSTLNVDGKEISFIENEYYKHYADFYGKVFYERYLQDNEKTENEFYNK